MQRATSIGTLAFDGGLWLGRYQDARAGADVELLVDGDESGPDPGQIDIIARFLSDFENNVLRFRRKLFLAGTYYPIRIAVTQQGSLGVQFQSILPCLKRRMVQDNGRAL